MRIGVPTGLHLLGQASRLSPMRRFAHLADRPAAAQRAKLLDLLSHNAATEYGKAHGFSSVRGPEDFARRVPLVTPEGVQPFVERQMRGERGILTAEPPVYYTRTSGSTGASKHVPITDAYRRDFQKTVHVALGHLFLRFPSAFLGRALYFVGSRKLDRAADGCDVGTMSGFNFTEMPPLIRRIYAWPYELFEVADLRSRTYLALYLALTGDVSIVAGIFPAPIVYLLRDLEARGAELAHDLRRGTLSGSLVLSPDQRAFFARRAARRPRVAARLERALAAPASERVSIALPMLRLVYCWVTATAALYVPELQRRVGPAVAVRDAIYSATEAWCTIPMGDREPGGPLALDSGYYEFIPEEAFERGSRETVGIEALEDGRRYAIVTTTAAGLYRYLLGDIVEVRGRYRNTPRVLFVRRAGAKSNLIGENLDEVHVTGAVSAALGSMGLDPTWFSLAPRLGEDRPAYTLHLELPVRPGDDALAAIADRVDAELRVHAYDYGRVRKAETLGELRVRCLPPGSYDAYRQQRMREGSAEAQLKTAHLVADVSALPVGLG
jgi:hypothetical protein